MQPAFFLRFFLRNVKRRRNLFSEGQTTYPCSSPATVAAPPCIRQSISFHLFEITLFNFNIGIMEFTSIRNEKRGKEQANENEELG
jgi:hypothetical protein